jgi:hypothetical protein
MSRPMLRSMVHRFRMIVNPRALAGVDVDTEAPL